MDAVTTCDVVVVGAGPTGLTLACELQLAGARTVVVEKLPEPVSYSKALGVHARTLELWQSRGLLEPLLADHMKLRAGNFASLGVPLRFGDFGSEHPYALFVPQVRTEELLTARALELGVEIRRGQTVAHVDQDAEAVHTTITSPDGSYQQSSRYLVGCDGGSSTVRKLMGIDFPGQEPCMSAVIVDAKFAEELPRGEGMGPMRPFGVTRPDLRAWCAAFPLTPEVFRTTVAWFGRPIKRGPVTEAEVSEALTEVAGSDFGMYDIEWMSRLTDVSRQASRYREGRVFLAGDSAHIHLPAGGQGLNLGVQDAMNLGWKLAAAVKEQASKTLLDTYESERYPVAEGVLRNTRAQAVLIDPDPRNDGLRELFIELLHVPESNRHIAGMISGLSIRYDIPGDHHTVGQRLPSTTLSTPEGDRQFSDLLHAGRPLLLVFGDAAAPAQELSGWIDRIDVVHAEQPDHPAFAGAYAFLIRPDGYVCATSQEDGQGLRGAASTWFGEPTQ